MEASLPAVSHAHHAVLRAHVERLNALADCLNGDCLDTSLLTERLAALRELHEALRTQLLPHMEAVETAVYPTLQKLLSDVGATAPMAREHEEIRDLVRRLGTIIEGAESHVDRGAVLAARRVLLRLYALLKIHLIEEELYLPILERNLSPEQERELAHALDHVIAAGGR